jgi:hypothetical protein
MMKYLASEYLVAPLALGCLLAAGCGSRPPALNPEQAHLVNLSLACGLYMSKHQGAMPPNEASFKKFLETVPAKERAARGVTGDVKSMFVSPRDNKPYVVRYGLKTSGVPMPGKEEVIAYEQTGSGGQRYVAFESGRTDEVDEARFKQLVPKS